MPGAPPVAPLGGAVVPEPSAPELLDEPVDVTPPAALSPPTRGGVLVPNGLTQVFADTVVAAASIGAAGGGEASSSPEMLPPCEAGPDVSIAAQVQPLGQSPSVAQVVARGAHEPGNEVVVMHSGVPASSPGEVPPPLFVAPVASPALLAPPFPPASGAVPRDVLLQAPETVGWQTNPSPQSLSKLHGSCHLNAQILRVVVVHVSSVIVMTKPASHGVFAAQADIAEPPPEQVVDFCS